MFGHVSGMCAQVLELSGTPDKLEAFIKLCEDIGIIEMARSAF